MILKKITKYAGSDEAPWTRLSSNANKLRFLGKLDASNSYNECVGRIFRAASGIGTIISYSDNNGVSWKNSNMNSAEIYGKLAIANEVGTVYSQMIIGSSKGLLHSGDNGQSFSTVSNASIQQIGTVNCVAYVPKADGFLIGTNQGLYIYNKNGIQKVDWYGTNTINSICVDAINRIIYLCISSASAHQRLGVWSINIDELPYLSKLNDYIYQNAQSPLTDKEHQLNSVGEAKIGVLHLSPAGRLFVVPFGSNNFYYKDPGNTWVTKAILHPIDHTPQTVHELYILSTGLMVMTGVVNYYYSSDGGDTWTRSNLTGVTTGYNYKNFDTMIETNTQRLLAEINLMNGGGGSYPDYGIWCSDTEYTEVCTKYLDQKGAQEIVTQFKAYCDNLVGGA